MGLINLIRNFGRLARVSWSQSHAPDWVFDSQMMRSGSSIPQILAGQPVIRPAENVMMVFGCLTARREAMALPPILLADDDENVIESGPAFELLKKPNSQDNWPQYVRKLETYLALYDMAAIAKIGDGVLPDELIPLSPAYLRPKLGLHGPSGTAVPVEWHYTDPWTGAQRIFKPEEIIIHQGFNPDAPLSALSPVRVLYRTMQAELAAREQNLSLFLNDSTPRGVLETEKDIAKEQADVIQEKWDDSMKGVSNRHRTPVLWGTLKYKPIGLTPAEMDFLGGLKFLRTDYYMAFRICPAMVWDMMGETGLSQGSSTKDQVIAWWNNVGLPELGLIASLHQELVNQVENKERAMRSSRSRLGIMQRAARNRSLRRAANSAGDGVFAFFDDNAIPALVEHRLSKVQTMTQMIGLGYRPDEVSEFLDLGLPPHPDNLGRVAFSLSEIGGKEKDEGGRLKDEGGTGKDEVKDEATEAVERLERTFEMLAREKADRAKKMKEKFDKFCAPIIKDAAKKVSRFFVEQRGRVLERMGKQEIQRADKIATDTKDTQDKRDKLMAAVFPRDEEDMALMARLSPLWTSTLVKGVELFQAETGAKVTESLSVGKDPRLTEALKRRTIQGLKINDTTEEDLRKIFDAAFEEGLTTVQMADKIAEYYAANGVGEESIRSQTAAMTQTTGLVNDGKMIAANDVGGLLKGWLHGGSKDARPAHLAAQAQYLDNPIPLDEPFVVNGFECNAPGDESLPPEEVCNCSCMVTFVKDEGGRLKAEA